MLKQQISRQNRQKARMRDISMPLGKRTNWL